MAAVAGEPPRRRHRRDARYLLLTTGVLFVAGYVVLAYFIWKRSRRDAIGKRFASRRTERLLSAGLGPTMAAVAEVSLITTVVVGLLVTGAILYVLIVPDAARIHEMAVRYGPR